MRELAELLEIKKAFEANPGETDIAKLFDGPALSMQYIDGLMTSLVATEADFAFLNELPKRSVDQTVVEYNKQRALGDNWYRSSFVGQSQDPPFADPYIKRLFDQMAYLSEGFRFNRVITKTRNIQDPEILESTAAARRMLAGLSRSLWHGAKRKLPVEMDGIVEKVKALGPEFVYDCRGKLPDAQVTQHFAAEIRSRFYGIANKFYVPFGTKNLIDNSDLGDKQHVYFDANGAGGIYQSRLVEGVRSSQALNGKLLYCPDLWIDTSNIGPPTVIDRQTGLPVESAVGEDPPDLPGLAVASLPPSVPGSLWSAADAGAIRYRVVALGANGSASQATPPAGATIGANGAAVLTITPALTGAPVESFVILRETAVGSNKYLYIDWIPRNAAAASTVFTDLNSILPGTSIGVMGDFNSRGTFDETGNIMLSELMQPLKTLFPAGIGGLRMNTGMVEYYCVLQCKKPESLRIFLNMPVQ